MRVAPIASVRSVTVPSVSNQESPMDTQDLLQHVPERARFSGTKMTKLDCFRSDRLLVGLNCFEPGQEQPVQDRKSTRLNSSHSQISYAVFCLKKKK